MERMLVSGVAADKKVSRISIMGINDEPGKAFEVFSLMAKEKVSVDIILQSTGADGKQNISFTIGEDDLDIALKALEKNKERLTAREIVHDENTAKLSIVGAGMATNPGVAAMFFEAMYDAGVNIQMISTSEIKITVLIAKDDVDAAMVAVHDEMQYAMKASVPHATRPVYVWIVIAPTGFVTSGQLQKRVIRQAESKSF